MDKWKIFSIIVSMLFLLLAYFFAKQIEASRKFSKFFKLMEKGNDKIKDAFTDFGYAELAYKSASVNYENGYYSTTKSYADYCNAYYGYAYGFLVEAKGFFEEAKKFSSKENLKLAELYTNFTECQSKIANELHQACEYLSSASGLYDKGDRVAGNEQIEKMNEHIKEYDKLIHLCNDYYAKIKAMLETL